MLKHMSLNENNNKEAKSGSKTKFIISLILPTVVAVLISIAAPLVPQAFAIDGPKNGRLVFSYDDAKNDDYGPGSYSYPLGQAFKANAFMFDLRRIRIYEIGKFYRFDIEYKGKIVRSWPGYTGHRNGWLFNIAEIYIDTDNRWGSGHKKAVLGRNVAFPPESCWEKVVFIGPVANDLMVNEIRDKTEDLEFAASLNDFVFPSNIDVYDYTLSATINRSEIGEFSDKWGIQVLSTVFDNSSSSATFYNKRVYKSSSDNEFGGASDLFGSPNVLDIIVPQGMSQKDILSKYRVHPNYTNAQFAVVPMVYAGGVSAASRGSLVAKADDSFSKNVKSADEKLELKEINARDSAFEVKERDFEEFKNEKEKEREKINAAAKTVLPESDSAFAANKNGGTEEEISDEAASIEETGNGTKPLRSKNSENIENNKDGEYKINKSKSDTKKEDGAKKLAVAKKNSPKKKNLDKYDEFMAKLEGQKLKIRDDDEEEAFNDVEKFLTKQNASVYKKNTGSGEKMKDFDPDVYEMAKIDDSKKNKAAVNKTAAAPKKDDKLKTQAADGTADKTETLKPLIEDQNETAVSEPEDKSVLGRLFGQIKKNRKRSAKHAVSDETKVVSEEAMVGIAKNELPDNSPKKSGTGTQAPALVMAAEDGKCAGNMKKLYEISVKYIEQNPEAQKISMNMLITAGLLDKPLKCEDGGRYLIEVKNSKPRINCINVNNSGHGSYTR
ncbi:MAG: hypothetical protein A2008_12025 [Candidatus Wallbacteria bacterium GWC2_49_35]|uniref:Glucodextranase-like C-terminal domain-containing protein n=1 Tax=Candidatus Wallbacteria bacterium GWC2_49_35 TaxID=1817813 RepID=A0A1F7WXZ7_9BACT|nr:MAG: hypothetical protein A2008_12025 [Candidatus Wallbacteria bacterium GWC2_49_35]